MGYFSFQGMMPHFSVTYVLGSYPITRRLINPPVWLSDQPEPDMARLLVCL